MANSRKLNVGLVFDDSLDSTDGVAQYVKILGAWLSGQGHDVSYLVGETKIKDWKGGKVNSLSDNINVSFNNNKLSMPLPGRSGAVKEVLASHKFDVLHVMVPFSPFMGAKVINLASRSTAVVGTFHIFPSGRLAVFGSRVLRIILAASLRRFDRIVSVSTPAAEFARQVFHIEPEVIPNPVEIKHFQTRTRNGADKHTIVFLGRLVKRKGADQLIEAFSELSKTGQQAKLIIAGDGPQRKMLETKVNRLGLADRVNFLGYVPEKNKAALLGSAGVACFPSLYGEAFGIVLIEAMAAGAGVVLGGDNPGYRSVLGGRPELLVDPTDVRAFAGRLNQLLSDSRLRGELHDWQISEVQKYDIVRVGPQIEEMYRGAIARLSKTSHNNHYG